MVINWTGDPNHTPQETLVLADIVGVAYNSTSANNTTNSIGLNLGSAFSGETFTKNAMLFSPAGFLSIPMTPGTYDNSGNFNGANTSPQGAQCVAWQRNDQWIVLATRDTRNQFSVGNLQPGDTAAFSSGSAAATVWKSNGAVIHKTIASDNTSTVQETISPEGWTVNTPWGNISLTANGFFIQLSNGATFALGGFSLIPGASSFASLVADNVSIPGSTVMLGLPGPNGYSQVSYGSIPNITGGPTPGSYIAPNTPLSLGQAFCSSTVMIGL